MDFKKRLLQIKWLWVRKVPKDWQGLIEYNHILLDYRRTFVNDKGLNFVIQESITHINELQEFRVGWKTCQSKTNKNK